MKKTTTTSKKKTKKPSAETAAECTDSFLRMIGVDPSNPWDLQEKAPEEPAPENDIYRRWMRAVKSILPSISWPVATEPAPAKAEAMPDSGHEPLVCDGLVDELARAGVEFHPWIGAGGGWSLWMSSSQDGFGVSMRSSRDAATGEIRIHDMDGISPAPKPGSHSDGGPFCLLRCRDVEEELNALLLNGWGVHCTLYDIEQILKLASSAEQGLLKLVAAIRPSEEDAAFLHGEAMSLGRWSSSLMTSFMIAKSSSHVDGGFAGPVGKLATASAADVAEYEKKFERLFSGTGEDAEMTAAVSAGESIGDPPPWIVVSPPAGVPAGDVTADSMSYLPEPLVGTSAAGAYYTKEAREKPRPDPLPAGVCCIARYWPSTLDDGADVELAVGVAGTPDWLFVKEDDAHGGLSARLDSSVVPVDRVMKPVGGGQAEEAIAFLHDPNVGDDSKKRLLGIMAGALSAVNDAEQQHSLMFHGSPHWQLCWMPALEEIRLRAIGYAIEHGISLPEYGGGSPEDGVVTEVILEDGTGFGTAFRKGMPILLTGAGRKAWRRGDEYIEVVSPADGTSVMLARTRLKKPAAVGDPATA